MNKFLLLFFNVLIPSLLLAQLTVVSTEPVNLAKNVPLVTTISITFSEALDTMAMKEKEGDSWFSNIDSVVSYGFSSDATTSFAVVALEPNTDYFFALMYAKAKSGAVMNTPHVYYFTTGADFSPYSVSGTLSPGAMNVPVAGAIVALSKINFMEEDTDGPPPFGGWAIVNANGTFTIPYVANGKYWPLAAKDVDGNGSVDPGRGADLLVMGDSIIVNNASVTGVDLTFFDIVSVTPANLTTNVPLNTTISITFSEPIDTMAMMEREDSWFSNIDSMVSYGYTDNGKTSYANVVLKPNTTYFMAFMYMKASSGSAITTPQIFYFTTAPAFETTTVSGTVSSGSTGVSPEGAIVGLAKIDFINQKTDGAPPFGGWGGVNANGTYTIPYVPNGTYWPMAAKDVDHDGRINPDNGVDVMAFGDSIVVNNASVTGVELTFLSFTPNTFHQVVNIVDSIAAADLPADRSLRRISGWEVDTLGRSRSWEFVYSINENTAGKAIRIGTMDRRVEDIDFNYFQWIRMLKPITGYDAAATSTAVIASVEAAGGKEIRTAWIPEWQEFRIELSMSSQQYGWFGGHPEIDTNKIYWAAAYAYNHQFDQDHSEWVGGRMFLCDLNSAAVLLTQDIIMDVKDDMIQPVSYMLSQNFPNPFNPATKITFAVPVSNSTTLKIFDMLGREVAVLLNEKKDAGTYTVTFTASNLPSGVYFYQLRSGNFVETKKMILMK
ncbi:MAG: Ig-like domain-containing protein [Bacteroidota bacterium]